MVDVLAIVGPTASGKTALSLELAKRFDGEIINGDSMQVYRGLSIGTAKITPEEMNGIPHHLLDIKDPDESFSVAEYQKLVREKIKEINDRGKLPILVGGTGLYVQAVLFDYRFAEQQVDEKLRSALYEELEQYGPLHMHDKLISLNPEADIHPNNTRRVVRAIEIALSGQEKSERNRALDPLYNEVIVGLDISRELLYKRINRRVDLMMDKGFLEEVKTLRSRGIRETQSMQAIGYKELQSYLDGESSLEEAVAKLKQNSRKYAKRQFTYFKNKLPVFWIDAMQEMEKNIQKITCFMQENNRDRRIQLLMEQKQEQEREGGS